MRKEFDKLYFGNHGDLGDSFISAGMVHYYADKTHELHVSIHPKNEKTLKCLYQDYNNIKLFNFENDGKIDEYVSSNKLSRVIIPKLHTHYVRGLSFHPLWDVQCYTLMDLSYSIRYKNFKLPKYINGAEELYQKLASDGAPYILVHKTTGEHPQGIPINIEGFRYSIGLPPLKIIEIDPSLDDYNMLKWLKLIENATEIHVVPSSFHCLVDSIHTNAKLFYHDAREKVSMLVNSEWNNFKWNMVHYDQKY